nr:MAG TPA: hypothetical protein [Caudoviricetes sp.]
MNCLIRLSTLKTLTVRRHLTYSAHAQLTEIC